MNYQNKIILLCKSYDKDLDRVKVLFESIQKHNIDKIPFYLIIPKKDEKVFRDALGDNEYYFSFEEDYNFDVEQSHFSQQLYKMSFYKTGIAEYYYTMDSDMYFIRDFKITDFIADNDIPYFTIHECKDLLEYSENITGDNRLREWFKGEREKIMKLFGRKGKLYDYSGSAILYISSVFEQLEEIYCKSNNLTFLDLLKFCPSENTWYGECALYLELKFYPCGPMFKTFHYSWQYQLAKNLNITEKSLSENYLGITMQSNWGAPLKY